MRWDVTPFGSIIPILFIVSYSFYFIFIDLLHILILAIYVGVLHASSRNQ